MLGMLIMIGFITIGVTAVSYGLLQSQVFQKVNVAIAIPETESEMRIVTQYVSNMDSVKNICEFFYYDEARAWRELENGNIQAIISFPENFFYEVYVGENPPANIYFEKTDEVNLLVFRELLKSAISYLQISESGVYASLTVAQDYKIVIEEGMLGDHVAGLYAKQILKRARTFEKEVISPLGMYQYEEYFLSAAILTILLMCGIQFGYLYQKRNRVIAQKLKMEGIGPMAVSMVRTVVMAIVLWIIASVVYTGIGVLAKQMEYDFADIRISIYLGAFLLCMSIAAYFHGIYSLANDSMNGTLLILVINIFMIVCSGILIPSAYLPKWAVTISKFTPFSIWNQFCNQLIMGELTMNVYLQIIGISVIGVGIGMGALWKNT